MFEHPSARVFPVTNGTAANALVLTALCPPWGAVLSDESAHILNSEGGATSMLGGGAVMKGVAGHSHQVHPDGLGTALDSVRWGNPHRSQPAVLSLTQPTDMGTIYTVAEIAAPADIAQGRGLRVHIGGARLADATARLGCTPADVTWRAGAEVITLCATKNGALSAEAIVVFDDQAADELVYSAKHSGHVTSKMRFQSTQLSAYLTDDLWLRLAGHSNRQMERLAAGLLDAGIELLDPPDVNMVFASVPDEAATRLEAAGLLFYRIGPGLIRLVTSWQTSDADIDQTLERFISLL